MKRFLVLLLFVAAGSSPALAQQPPANAVTDADIQGEYRGTIYTQPSALSARAIGLQVVALGRGQFTCWKYEHGLPGEGARGNERYEYTGSNENGVAYFPGSSYNIEIDGRTARVFRPDGELAGILAKVQRSSPSMNAPPPTGAVVLFGNGQAGPLDRPRVTPEGYLSIGTQTSDAYGDFVMHLEFMTPFEPTARGQGRGNSGLYIQSRYELQILDSFGLAGANNECGAIYTQQPPRINMCLPPLVWQTYDIDFTSPRFDDQGNKVADAVISVWHNGVPIHSHYRIIAKTGQGSPEGPQPLPTKFQDHRNPVVFRNIWLLPKSESQIVSRDWLKVTPTAPPVPLLSSQRRPVSALFANYAGYDL